MADVERVLSERTKGKVMAGDRATVGTEDSSFAESFGPGCLPPLEWRPPVKGMEAILSACGRYSVARAWVNGVASYQAWVRLPTPHLLGEPQASAEMAKQVVEAHAQSR